MLGAQLGHFLLEPLAVFRARTLALCLEPGFVLRADAGRLDFEGLGRRTLGRGLDVAGRLFARRFGLLLRLRLLPPRLLGLLAQAGQLHLQLRFGFGAHARKLGFECAGRGRFGGETRLLDGRRARDFGLGARAGQVGLAVPIGIDARLSQAFGQLPLHLLARPFQLARQLLLGLRARARQLAGHRLARGGFGLGAGFGHGPLALCRGRHFKAGQLGLPLGGRFGLDPFDLHRQLRLGVRLDERELGGVHLRIDAVLGGCRAGLGRSRGLTDVGLLLAVHFDGHRVDTHRVDQGVDLGGHLRVVGGAGTAGVACAHVVGLGGYRTGRPGMLRATPVPGVATAAGVRNRPELAPSGAAAPRTGQGHS